MLRLLRYIIAAGIICGAAWPPPLARADDSKEYLVKAAFIYNFVKFVEWPDGRAIAKLSNLDICTIGSSPLDKAGEVFKAASTAKLKLTLVEENDWKKAAEHCHIVFISPAEEDKLNEILGVLKGQPVLTVSDIDDFAARGGMVGFVTNDNKIKIEVNKRPVAAAGLRIDAQLLEIALRVIDR